MEKSSINTIQDTARKVLPLGLKKVIARILYRNRKSGNHDESERFAVAKKFIKGEGIEIGALHLPLKVPNSVKVRYVDRMTTTELRRHYPELNSLPLVNIDIIDDGERLGSVQDSTQDFVIANHFIEHCQNPLMTLGNFLRVLKIDGVLYLAIPDKRFTFDIDRTITPLEHILRDYEEGGEWSRRQHFEEWVRFVNKVEGESEVKNRVEELMNLDYSIHFHAWTQLEMFEFILAMNKKLGFIFEIEAFRKNGDECIFILRRAG